jgi:hypothetical protein
MENGWNGYLMTFMSHDLSGPMEAQISQMHQEVTKVFSKLLTRTVRKPRSPISAALLPKGDLPILKRSKIPVRDATTNNGLHMHGVILANRWGRTI